ncbi:hypothetical protein PPYR_05383 [Photinus pyralis]|uniref:UMP-CMP kinase n=1 Tax=Photinus pyralis TaxID=7054 RepID=A0A1Y1JXN9_PHOPY|nr:UMP-CMP kinase-like [Photinus pyralis]KAB0801029.1 hypothetical protein PPYR_05383 [Photinus pyralis]
MRIFLSTFRYVNKMVPNVVFVLGGPGSGKGTQCAKIVKEFGYVHLSAGDLLREERLNPKSEFGELIEEYIREGKIVPVDITCSLLERAMEISGKDKFLIDGFPRNQDNLDGWNRRVADKVHLQFILCLECPSSVFMGRLMARGAAGSGRSDDNLVSAQKRLNIFTNETTPIIDHYRNLNMVRTVDATQSIEKVFEDIKVLFKSVEGNSEV